MSLMGPLQDRSSRPWLGCLDLHSAKPLLLDQFGCAGLAVVTFSLHSQTAANNSWGINGF